VREEGGDLAYRPKPELKSNRIGEKERTIEDKKRRGYRKGARG